MTPRQRNAQPPQLAPPQDIRTSGDFLAYVENQKINAQRRIDDRRGQITELETDSARLKADYESAVHRNNIAIAEHRIAIDDDAAIVSAAERVFDFGRAGVRQPTEEQESSE